MDQKYIPTNWDLIHSSLTNFLKLHNLGIKFSLEEPKDIERGFYTTNIAMVVAKAFKQSPIVIAQQVIDFFKKDCHIFDQITFDVVKPGFINFGLTDILMWNVCEQVLSQNEDYGRGEPKKYKYNIEIVSANPTGQLHIGHARNGVIGDCVARILKFNGYDVVVEHYTNDAGNQINILALTIFIHYLKICGVDTPLPEGCYKGNFYESSAQKIFDEHGDKFKDVKYSEVLILNSEVNAIFKQTGINYFLGKNKSHLKLMNIHIDNYISEQFMYDSGKINVTLAEFAAKNVSYQLDGALWLKTTNIGDEKDRVIIKSDGTYTYLLPDVTGHWDKLSRTNADKLVNLWGGDHHDYIKRMQSGLTFLGAPSNILEVDVISMVRLVKDGREYKMSKRAGTAVWLIDLYNLIGGDVMRYMLASKPGSSPMDLDVDTLQDRSRKNPIFYIQYAVSRCASIIRHFEESEVATNSDNLAFKPLIMPLEFEAKVLLNKLDAFPRTVQISGTYRTPHFICDYLYDLAKKFHIYYNRYKILNLENKTLSQQRLLVVEATLIVLRNGLDLIGIIPRTSM